MAVAYEAGSESHTGTTGNASADSFTWNHGGTAPRGVLVFTFVTSNNDYATAVTYGGQSLTAVTGGQAADATTEAGRTKAWFLGTGSIPTGTQAVVVTRTNNTTVMYAVCVTVTAASDTEFAGVTLLQDNQTVTTLSVDDGTLSGTNSVRFSGFNSGATAEPTPAAANSSGVAGIAFTSPANRSAGVARETTAGIGARSVGWSSVADDTALVSLAIREMSRSQTVAVGTATLTGTIPDIGRTVTAAPTVGSVAVSGQVPVALRDTFISPTVGAAVLTGKEPAVSQGTFAFPTVGSLVATGQVPAAVLARTVRVTWAQLIAPAIHVDDNARSPTVAVVDVTGLAPTVRRDAVAQPAAGSVVATGQTPTTFRADSAAPTSGVAAFTGLVPALEISNHRTVAPAVGVLEFTGIQPIAQLAGGAYPAVAALTFTGGTPAMQRTESATPGVGALAFSGRTPTVGVSDVRSASPAAGTVAITGLAPTTSTSAVVVASPPVGTVTATGLAPTIGVTGNVVVAPAVCTLAISGRTPSAQVGNNAYAYPAAGEATITGRTPTVSVTYNVVASPAAGSLTASGLVPTVTTTSNVVAAPAVAAVAITGTVPTVQVGNNAYAYTPPATVAATGHAPTVSVTYNVAASPAAGMLATTGLAPTALRGTVTTPARATLTTTGVLPTVRRDVIAQPTAVVLSLVGRTPVATQSDHHVHTVPAGVVNITGIEPRLGQSDSTSPAVGSVAITGNALTVKLGTVVPINAGTATLTGIAPTVQQTADVYAFPPRGVLEVSRGNVDVTVSDVASIAAASGNIIFLGFAPRLIFATDYTTPELVYMVPAESRRFTAQSNADAEMLYVVPAESRRWRVRSVA